jgi:hypothetical protein
VSSSRLESEFRSYWNCWLDNEETEAQLRLYSMPIIEEFRRAVQDLNWSKAERLQNCYSFIADNCSREPLLSAYELGQMHILLCTAEYFAMIGEWQQARANIDQVEEALRIGDERRAELGMAERPNSEVRLNCLSIRAMVLVGEGDSQAISRSAAQSAEEFHRLASSYLERVQESKRDDEQYQESILQSVAALELEVLKLCRLADAELTLDAIANFNERIGHHIEFDDLHFKSLEPFEQRSAWYWDYELFKLIASGSENREDINYCARERRGAARLTFGAGPLRALELKWTREMRRYRR